MKYFFLPVKLLFTAMFDIMSISRGFKAVLGFVLGFAVVCVLGHMF